MSPRAPRPSADDAATDPYATFRPRWGTRVPTVMALVVLLAFAVAAVTIPGANWMITDRIFLFGLGAVTSWFLSRFARIEAKPSERGLIVRNLFLTRRLEWHQILRLQFGGGAPWASLDLNDTDTVAVMAIQKADGERAQREAARLAALIEYHGGVEPVR
ncbi:MAG: PH domain-containing protein [Dermatophilus congolensis]|nr:PH domain-containing protein [Dermatophilus congolensis]